MQIERSSRPSSAALSRGRSSPASPAHAASPGHNAPAMTLRVVAINRPIALHIRCRACGPRDTMNHNAIVNAAGQPHEPDAGFEGRALTRAREGGSPFIGREGPLDHPSRPEGVPHATGGRKEQHLACEARATRRADRKTRDGSRIWS